MTVVPGHGLVSEGAAHDDAGARLWAHTGNAGRGKCSCGELSESLASGAARKAWHRRHKDDVTKLTARAAWPLPEKVAALIDPDAFRWDALHAERQVARGKAHAIRELVSAGFVLPGEPR